MKRPSSSKNSSQFLVNKLTVADARHLLNNEGGELAVGNLAISVLSCLIVWGLCGWAIWAGKAIAWHLIMPMLAEYFALVLALPVLCFGLRVSELRPEAVSALRWLTFLLVGIAIYIAVMAYRSDVPWVVQGKQEWSRLAVWITAAQMHWPIIGAAIGMWISLPKRVENLAKYGPPFVGVSLGCGMRLVVFFFCIFLVPVIVSNPARLVWILWAAILIAELGALWMRWDIQQRLRRFEATAVK
jgi:hypothetical protein